MPAKQVEEMMAKAYFVVRATVADLDRDWPDITRTRETFVLAEEFAA